MQDVLNFLMNDEGVARCAGHWRSASASLLHLGSKTSRLCMYPVHQNSSTSAFVFLVTPREQDFRVCTYQDSSPEFHFLGLFVELDVYAFL